MKTYFIYSNEPRATMHKFDAGSKKEALKKFEEMTGRKYKFTSDFSGKERICIVRDFDYYHYNFRFFSYAVLA